MGVIPRALVEKEIGHRRSRTRAVDSMHERKALMAELADVSWRCRAGSARSRSFFEVYTWRKGLHRKACGLLDVEGYYSGLARFPRPRSGRALRRARSIARC